MPDLVPILALAVAYNLSWLLARSRGFTGVGVLTGWLAAAAAWSALSQGPSALLAAGLAAAAAWLLRGHWLHIFERPGVHCRELGGRLRLAGLGYGGVLNLEAPGDRSPRRARHTIWIEGLDGDALTVQKPGLRRRPGRGGAAGNGRAEPAAPAPPASRAAPPGRLQPVPDAVGRTGA
jgi:hypothetical protein